MLGRGRAPAGRGGGGSGLGGLRLGLQGRGRWEEGCGARDTLPLAGRRLERRHWRVGQCQVADGRWPGTENEAPAAGRLGEEARGRFSPKMDVGVSIYR